MSYIQLRTSKCSQVGVVVCNDKSKELHYGQSNGATLYLSKKRARQIAFQLLTAAKKIKE